MFPFEPQFFKQFFQNYFIAVILIRNFESWCRWVFKLNAYSLHYSTGNPVYIPSVSEKLISRAKYSTFFNNFLRYGIRCNLVIPGFINTSMTRTIPEKVKKLLLGRIALGRLGEPEGNFTFKCIYFHYLLFFEVKLILIKIL